MCDVTAAVVAAGAVAGGVAASSKKPGAQTTQTETKEPWHVQAPHLNNAFSAAKTDYETTIARPAWESTHDAFASVNGTQKEGAAVGADYARGAGSALGEQAANTSAVLMGAAPQYYNNASTLAATGAGPANGVAQGVLTQAAQGGLQGSSGVAGGAGLGGQLGALSTAQGMAAGAQGDGNAAIQSGAAGYMNSDLVNGQVDAATRDVARNLSEDVLPGLNARASAGGNINSARAGAAEAVARRGAEDRAADISTAIRNNAWNTGIQASLATKAQQDSTALAANAQAGSLGGALSNLGENQRQFNIGTQLQGASTLGSQDTANRALDVNTKLSAGNQLGTAVQAGLNGALTTGQIVDQNGARISAQGDLQMQGDQIGINNAQSMYYADEKRRAAALQDYYGIVGSQNWGGDGTRTVTGSPTRANVVGGALGGAMGAYGMMGAGGSGGGALAGLFGGGSGSQQQAPTYAPILSR
ncbi:hypothetical protein [Roseomonas indoligenes]|uniref:Uncharacterized protein n=1 Tax=Roseomonas indoligenes TaxID=2820811 RepID=A0A940MXS7_9PROT|nr:hypothetical protein [Pararoseomonas indoligenes]MBP0492774.1 hypothetical protein [Pararoseomonas indoligenes]